MNQYEIKEIVTLGGFNSMISLELQSYDTNKETILVEINNDELFDWLPHIVEKSLELRSKETNRKKDDIKSLLS